MNYFVSGQRKTLKLKGRVAHTILLIFIQRKEKSVGEDHKVYGNARGHIANSSLPKKT